MKRYSTSYVIKELQIKIRMTTKNQKYENIQILAWIWSNLRDSDSLLAGVQNGMNLFGR